MQNLTQAQIDAQRATAADVAARRELEKLSGAGFEEEAAFQEAREAARLASEAVATARREREEAARQQAAAAGNEDEGPLDDEEDIIPILEDLKLSQEFIDALKTATLRSTLEPLDEDTLDFIENPPTEECTVEDNPDLHLSIELYLAIDNAAEAVYNAARTAIMRRFRDCNILSFYKVKKTVEELTGVRPVYRDMCWNSCVAFTGPLSSRLTCPLCGEQRYQSDGKTPRKRFVTLLLAPQLQAMWRTPDGARLMQYRNDLTEKLLDELDQTDDAGNPRPRTSKFTDFFSGLEYLKAVDLKNIRDKDMVLVLLIDGAQLYRSKVSECWVYIWVILDVAPDKRYKKRYVLPGGFIPGPNKPKRLDSFLFPGLYHLCALQNDGLKIWRADTRTLFVSHPFLALVTADGPAMAAISGQVGHQGRMHCRRRCPIPGRRKEGGSQYYPMRQKPDNYDVPGSAHDDVDLNDLLQSFSEDDREKRYLEELRLVMRSRDQADYHRNRLQTGIVGPTIFSALPRKHRLGIPNIFPLDIMHLPALNIPDLLIPLWRGTFTHAKDDDPKDWPWAVLTGDVWKQHGEAVANVTPFIPSSFDRPPRNPAEKINSGYKAWEFLIYFFGIGPALLYGVLPDPYWKNYCQVVRAFHILMQVEISPDDLLEAHALMTQFSDGFEELYVQRRSDRIHFVRPSIHTGSHFPFDVELIGPGIVYSQWPVERAIGSLGMEMSQPGNMFANFEARGTRRCQTNSLYNLLPHLMPPKPNLRTRISIGSGYMLAGIERSPTTLRACELAAIQGYFTSKGLNPQIDRLRRWSHLYLPSGQVARTYWKESMVQNRPVRRARCVLCNYNGQERVGEVLYFVRTQARRDQPAGELHSLAVLCLLDFPNKDILAASYGQYWTAAHIGDAGLVCMDAHDIFSSVIMAPDYQYGTRNHDGTEGNRWYISRRPGDAVMSQLDTEESDDEDAD
ncbi:hypothetical protein CYLTODRAFT_359858 [Cylindrobasidium torrendii FP15055 ss-10]|uniref:Uncharacterized protein n=1 Tax=Cylindrobasidium torrendii FP15055 ss-10 TaxID=1314674 RepID=A0A0D7AZV1_9AGAR|nr:hypothetical protein CYLTODRAFT_361205 [Cylindrobasidium torrendii FP15055 ss-10]KIY63500.1 hypothetical protein CYLTODRAFT_359858 [Cylindrobasidium torrendii FP15055 ss-10]